MAVVAPLPTPSAPPSTADLQQHDDTLMRDILQELDREREKRAELESQLRALEQQSVLGSDEMVISKRHYIALQEELRGYRKLVDVMTGEKPAIAAALKANIRQRILQKQHESYSLAAAITTAATSSTSSIPPTASMDNNNNHTMSLPLHVVRVLEIMPWDERANEYAFAKEEMYEWQFYCHAKKAWLKEIRLSPKLFKDLPTEEPRPGVNAESNNQQKGSIFLPFFACGDSMVAAPPSQSSVLTNATITKKFNLQRGYPLPENGGTWQWVGGWRVEKRVSLNQDHSEMSSSRLSNAPRSVDCDDEGWSYAMEPNFFLLNTHETCFNNPGTIHGGKGAKNDDATFLRPVRRRKWTRQRALVDYPHASESSRCFLRLMAQRMYATMTANKMSEQLVETKVALTEAESTQMQCKDVLTTHVRKIKLLLETQNKLMMAREVKSTIRSAMAAADEMQQEILQLLD